MDFAGAPAQPERASQSPKGTGLTRRSLALFVLALVLLALAGGTAASTARAGGATGLIKDASDGVVNGTYSAATVRSALSMVRSDPAYTMYSDIEGVLVDYLASITNPDGGGGGGGGRQHSPAGRREHPRDLRVELLGRKGDAQRHAEYEALPGCIRDADAHACFIRLGRTAFAVPQRHRVGSGQVPSRRRSLALRAAGRRDRRGGRDPAPAAAALGVAGAAPHRPAQRSRLAVRRRLTDYQVS